MKQTTNSKRAPKSKFYPETYITTYQDFEDAMNELRSAITVANDLINFGEEDEVTVDTATESIIAAMAERVPRLIGKRNIHTSLSVSSNKCFIRTEEGIGFGWNCSYKVEDGQAVIECVDLIVTLYKPDNELVDDLLSHGWEKQERRSRR